MDLERYTATKLLVNGNQAKIYKAQSKDKSHPFTVVIKAINMNEKTPSVIADALEEISVMKKLTSGLKEDFVPGSDINAYIVRYIEDYEIVSDRKRYRYIVMEDLTSWLTVDEYMRRLRKASPCNRIYPGPLKLITTNLLKGLAYIHSHNVVHRDIKPENIMIDQNCNIKYIDFGLSSSSCFNFNGVKGTPLYLPPESPVFLDDTRNAPANLSPKEAADYHLERGKMHDIWSLGLVIYQLSNLARYPDNLPFDFSNTGDVFSFMTMLRKQPITYPSEYLYEYGYTGLNFNDLITMMLTSDPMTRPNITTLLEYIFQYT